MDEPLETLHPALRHQLRDHLLTVKTKAIVIVTHAAEVVVPPLLEHLYRFRQTYNKVTGIGFTEVYDIREMFDQSRSTKMELVSLAVESTFREIFFTRGVILVEGINDKRVLECLNFVIRHRKSNKLKDIRNIHWPVIAIGGKGRFPAAVYLAKNMGVEWVCIMDLDALLPDDPNIRTQLKDYNIKIQQQEVVLSQYKSLTTKLLRKLSQLDIEHISSDVMNSRNKPLDGSSIASASLTSSPDNGHCDSVCSRTVSNSSDTSNVTKDTFQKEYQSTEVATKVALKSASNTHEASMDAVERDCKSNTIHSVVMEDKEVLLRDILAEVRGVDEQIRKALQQVDQELNDLIKKEEIEKWNLAITPASPAYLVISHNVLQSHEQYFDLTKSHDLEAFLHYCAEKRVFCWKYGDLESLMQQTFPDFSKSRWAKLFFSELVEYIVRVVEDEKNTEIWRLISFLNHWKCLELRRSD
jgi:hypothetical protein